MKGEYYNTAMTEHEGSYDPITKVIEALEAGVRPIDQYLGRSFRELYMSGQYRSAALWGTDDVNEEMTAHALRIVGIRNNRLDSLVIGLDESASQQKNRFLNAMRQGLQHFPPQTDLFRHFEDTALKMLEQQGLQTVAAMQFSTSTTTGNEVLQVHYPKIFREIIPVPSELRDTSGLAAAGYFLNKVPFGKNPINISSPSQ